MDDESRKSLPHFVFQNISPSYFDAAGREVVERHVIQGDPPEGWTRFIGVMNVMQTDEKGHPVAQMRQPFPIPTKTGMWDEVYGTWDACRDAEFKRMQAAEREQAAKAKKAIVVGDVVPMSRQQMKALGIAR